MKKAPILKELSYGKSPPWFKVNVHESNWSLMETCWHPTKSTSQNYSSWWDGSYFENDEANAESEGHSIGAWCPRKAKTWLVTQCKARDLTDIPAFLTTSRKSVTWFPYEVSPDIPLLPLWSSFFLFPCVFSFFTSDCCRSLNISILTESLRIDWYLTWRTEIQMALSQSFSHTYAVSLGTQCNRFILAQSLDPTSHSWT